MTVVFSRDGRDFVRRDWSRLVELDPSGSVFHLPQYLKLYWEEFVEDGELLLAFVEQAGRTVGACAFELEGTTLRFLGGTEVTDYMGPVAAPGSNDEVAKELLHALSSDDRWDSADLRGLPQDSGWLGPLEAAAVESGLEATTEQYDVTPLLKLPSTWEEYLAGLPPKLRHEVKRKERKLSAETGGYRVVFATEEDAGDALDRFVALHQSSEGPKGKFMQPGMEIFFRRLAGALLREGAFRLAFIESGGELIAGAIYFRFRNTVYLYNSAFDHSRSALSPGMVLVGELIRMAIDEGCETFDLLKGDLEYKYRFGARPKRLVRIELRKRTR